MAGAMAALYGPLHGGANEAVLRMLVEIGTTTDNIPAFMESVRRGERRLMGFGHRVYKAYDPRATIIKKAADEVFEVTGRNPLLDIAPRTREDRAAGRVLRQAQPVPERRLLLGADLPGAGLPGRALPGALRDPAHGRLARAVGGDGGRPRAEDRAAAPGLQGTSPEGLRADGGSVAERACIPGRVRARASPQYERAKTKWSLCGPQGYSRQGHVQNEGACHVWSWSRSSELFEPSNPSLRVASDRRPGRLHGHCGEGGQSPGAGRGRARRRSNCWFGTTTSVRRPSTSPHNMARSAWESSAAKAMPPSSSSGTCPTSSSGSSSWPGAKSSPKRWRSVRTTCSNCSFPPAGSRVALGEPTTL